MFRPDAYRLSKNLITVKTIALLENYFDLLRLRPDGHDRVLDVGCGDGQSTVDNILKRFPSPQSTILGTDKSQEMIDYAAKAYENNPRVAFERFDMDTKRLPANLLGKFDHVFALFSLNWSKDIEQTTKNLYELLRPGGDLFAIICTQHAAFYAFERIRANSEWIAYTDELPIHVYQKMHEPDRYVKELLTKTGFEVPLCKRWDTSYVCDYTEYRDFAMSVNPGLKRLPEKQWSKYMDDCMREYLNSGLVKINDGIVTNSFTLLTVVARKPEVDQLNVG